MFQSGQLHLVRDTRFCNSWEKSKMKIPIHQSQLTPIRHWFIQQSCSLMTQILLVSPYFLRLLCLGTGLSVSFGEYKSYSNHGTNIIEQVANLGLKSRLQPHCRVSVFSRCRWYLNFLSPLFFLKKISLFIHLIALFAYISAWQKRVLNWGGHQGIIILYGCDPRCGFWGLNSGPLKQQPVLLIVDPSLQPMFRLS